MSENERNLLEQFVRVQWLLGRYYFQNHMAHGPMGNPYRGQGRVLKLLKMQPEISQKDLSELLDMRPQSLGELLAKLEQSGYITRSPSENDKRVMIVRLTQAGAEAKGQEEGRPDCGKLFDCLSVEEQANLGEYLARLIAEFEKQFGDDGNWFENKWRGHHGFGFDHHKRGGPFGWNK